MTHITDSLNMTKKQANNGIHCKIENNLQRIIKYILEMAYRRNKCNEKLQYYLSLKEIFIDKRTQFLKIKREQKMAWITH